MVKIKVRGEFLYLEYVKDGKRVRKSTKLLNTPTNVKYLQKNEIPEIERKIGLGIDEIVGRKLSYFTDIILARAEKRLKFNSIISYRHGVKMFLKIIGDKPVDKYSVMDIERFAERVGVKSSAKVYLAPVSLAFKLAVKHDIIPRNPCTYADMPYTKPKIKKPFTIQQVKALLDNATGDLKTLLFLAFYTGARLGEILGLKWSDISDNQVHIRRTQIANGDYNSPKNGKERSVYLLTPLRLYLDKLPKYNEFIISRSRGLMVYLFKKLQKKLGYEARGFHTTRHTYTSLLMQSNVKPVLVQEMLGHSSLMMTSRYTHFISSGSDSDELEKALS